MICLCPYSLRCYGQDYHAEGRRAVWLRSVGVAHQRDNTRGGDAAVCIDAYGKLYIQPQGSSGIKDGCRRKQRELPLRQGWEHGGEHRPQRRARHPYLQHVPQPDSPPERGRRHLREFHVLSRRKAENSHRWRHALRLGTVKK